MAPVDAIRNLGPRSVEMFARAGLHTAEEVRALGANRAYARLLEVGIRPHFIGYYALVMGLQGRPWNDCQGKEKADLRKRFDTLKTNHQATKKGHAGIDAALAEIGVIERKV